MENREKYLSFVVPCYNSESYMARCIESLLPGGEDVEIIIIDDGSKDKTGEIADAYQKQYPDLVKVIHKENGGHGSGVNAGLACARGTAATARASIRASAMPPASTSRSWTPMTGWTELPIRNF